MEKEMIGWKQAYTMNLVTTVLVKLFIPRNARICRTANGIYRCDKARVVAITSLDGEHSLQKARSLKDIDFFYEVGKVVEPNNSMSISFCDFCGDPAKEKGPGIYFFKTKKEAIEYEY